MKYSYKTVGKGKTDRQKLIHTYIAIIRENNKLSLPYREYVALIKDKFNVDVKESEIRLYFEPNAIEDGLDTRLLYNSLGIRYG